MVYFVYVIYNPENNKIYIGQTLDLKKRLEQHNDHSFKKFTSRYPGNWNLVHKELFSSRKEVVLREKQLKSFRGREFIRLKINNIRE